MAISGRALAQIELCQLQIARLGNLQINLRAGHNGDRQPGPLHHGGFIGSHKAVRRRLSKCALQQAVAKALRRLREHDKLARDCRGDEGAMGSSFHLLDGVDGGHAHDGRAVLLHCVNGAVNGGRVDKRTHSVVDEDDVVVGGRHRGQRVRHGLLAIVAALDHVDAAGETILRHLGLDALHLRPAHSDVDRRHAWHRGEGAQRVDENGNSSKRHKLLGLWTGHAGAEPRRGKDCEYLHNSWSIHRQRAVRHEADTRNTGAIIACVAVTLALDTSLFKPGMRVAVGLSGGADSVALLRALVERSRELGIVLHAAHLHHGLRGEEADADLAFARELAASLGVPFHEQRVDTAAEAKAAPGKPGESIEEAARRLRYAWFRMLMSEAPLDAVATAHTLDDQAETVLARLLRGAWTEGIAGIHPVVEHPEGQIIRPMLATRREAVETYLRALGQPWREDSTNRHLTYTRNRIRHELLPLLETWNPQLRAHLAQMATLALDEEAWWQAEIARLAPELLLPGKPVRGGGRASGEGLALDRTRLAALPVPLQRRLLRHAAASLGSPLDFESTEAVRMLALAGKAGQKRELAQGLRAERTPRELRLTVAPAEMEQPKQEYVFAIPGEVEAPDFGLRVRVDAPAGLGSPAEACLRLWKPGDRVRLRYSRSSRKVKEVLERLHVTGTARTSWPVLEIAGAVVWMQGADVEPPAGVQVTATPQAPGI